jgi:hypothetical protein
MRQVGDVTWFALVLIVTLTSTVSALANCPPKAWASPCKTLDNFAGTDGACPQGALVRDRPGALYGLTIGAGANSNGEVYKTHCSGPNR